MTEIGPNFGSLISDVVNEPTVMDVGGLKLEKMLYNFESVATGNAEGAGNRLVLDYDVAFNNIHENVDASNEYFVTSGVAIYNAAGDQVIKNQLELEVNSSHRLSMPGCPKKLWLLQVTLRLLQCSMT